MYRQLKDYLLTTPRKFYMATQKDLCAAVAACISADGGLTSVATTDSPSVTWSGDGTAGSPLIATVVPVANTPNILIASTNGSGTIIDGSSNVITRPLTGFVVGANTTIAAADTILAAFQKTQGQINARVALTSAITGYVVGANTALAATDTILGAFGKIQGQINAINTGFADGVRNTMLTGFAVGANSTIATSDTVIQAFGKTQGQINTRAPLASPALTGTPTAPTAAAATNTTQIATTAHVQSAIAAKFISASSAPLTFGEVTANSFEDLGLTVTGAAIGDVVALGVPGAAQVDGAAFFAFVSNTDVVDIRCINPTTAPITVPEGTYKVTVFKL